MAQAPLHLRLEDGERLLPEAFASLAARIRYSRRKAKVVGSGKLFPVPLTLVQAESLLEDYKRLRETLGGVRRELSLARGEPFAVEHNNVYQYRKPNASRVKRTRGLGKPKIRAEWQKVLDTLGK